MTHFQEHIDILTRSMFTLERLWELAGFKPNEDQQKAIRDVEGPLYITAGPGSGKTRVLLWRTVNLIVFHQVKPEEIFLSTFTEKAAHQLKEGLRVLLGLATNLNGQPYDLTPMYIGTVHSLCQRIISDRRHFFLDRHRHQPPTLLDELGQYFHTARNSVWDGILTGAGLGPDGNVAINDLFGIPSQSKHSAVTNALSLFNRFSEECIDPDKALEKIDTDPMVGAYLQAHNIHPGQMTAMLKAYSAYRNSLQQNNARYTDFSLLQQEAFHVLNEHPGAGSAFKHIILDEYQDTNTIQERIFFKLAAGNKNICVVGDDDQALYRFRGATVENFVEFPARCQQYLGLQPKRISLSKNYRSRRKIVDFYKQFMSQIDWSKADGSGAHRVMDKDIQAHREDPLPSVVANTPCQPEVACAEIARLVRQLIDQGKVKNPNQIAFLFPSLKYRGDMIKPVERMKAALEEVGLQVYAPRAGRFLDVDESYDIFGLFVQIFGRPRLTQVQGHDFENYRNWLVSVEEQGEALMRGDPLLARFVKEKREEIQCIVSDYNTLVQVAERNHWDRSQPYRPEVMKRALHSAPGLSEQGKRLIASQYLDRYVEERRNQDRPLALSNILSRVTSLDWNVLDLFYRLCGFEHFKQMFDAAECNGDEGPVSNLGLITQYLARFVDDRIAIITAEQLSDEMFQRVFFLSYIFALYRLGETELEDPEDPFPKGRIPFLTIHQAKGLEFPVVVLGNPRKNDNEPNRVEVLVRPFLEREPGEPLERMPKFDTMRMFYVALSRAKNLLVIAHYKGQGQKLNAPFPVMLDDRFPRIQNLDLATIPSTEAKEDTLPKSYSFTSDYLMYKKCPRQYMIFRKFGFAPSRTQTMFFGNLVHRTLEDLHHELIRLRDNT
jgi:DNA helicase II / ATP-dependent DNA helicase PcrA